MRITETILAGCYIIEPTIINDGRGFFYEFFNRHHFELLLGQQLNFVQDNRSFSKKGVLRGLHYQKGEHAQAKLVSVLDGTVLDVVVDLREESPTFGRHVSEVLSVENKKQIFIPRGFAHGFVVLSDTAEFFYKCDNYYNKASEAGIIYNDPFLNIDWKLPLDELIISEKDQKLPLFKHADL